jgi:hypothetical protein
MKKILPFLLVLMGFGGLSAQYCLPTFNNQCTSDDFIDDVVFAGITNVNTGCGQPGPSNYSNFTNLVASVQPGLSYPITVQPGANWGQYFVAFIDFNGDLDFADAGEFFNLGYAAAGATLNGNITIPAAATAGNKRMRVLCRFGAGALAQGAACQAGLSYGECEDYTVFVGVPLPCGTPANIAVGNVTDVSATVTWTGPGNAVTYNVEYGPIGFVQGTGTLLAGVTSPVNLTGLSPNTNYQVIVRADCGPTDGLSYWSGPTAFLTACAPFPYPGNTPQGPIVVPSLPYNATGIGSDPCWTNASNLRVSEDVFYQFTTGPCAASVTVSLCGSSFDTYLYILDSTGTGTPLYSNDDACGSSSQVTFPCGPNQTFVALIEAFSGVNLGNWIINITDNFTPVTAVNFDVFVPSCAGSYDGAVEVLVTNGAAPYTVIWDDGDTTGLFRTGMGSGTYTVRVLDNCGSNFLGTVTVGSGLPLQALALPDAPLTVCPGTTVNLDGEALNGNEYPTFLNNFYGIDLDANQFVRFDRNNPDNATVIASNVTNNFFGGDLTPQGYYLLDNTNQTLVIMDTSSGNFLTIGACAPVTGHTWTGLAWDNANSVAYAVSTNITTSQLYVVDLSTGALLTGPVLDMAGPITLAIDNNGQAFALDVTTDSIYSVDLNTGAATPVASIGFDANFAQDADFDPVTGILYLAAYNVTTSAAELYAYDVNSGTFTALGPIHLGASSEIDALFIAPYTGGYTYQWSPGVADPNAASTTAAPTAPTTYYFTVTDACGTVAMDSVVVNVLDAPTATVAATDVACAGNNNGSLDLTANGGLAPYGYNWDLGFNSEDVTGLAAGTYTVTVTDGCSQTATATATVNEPAAVTPALDQVVDASCNGLSDGEILVSVSGGTAPYAFAWSNGDTTEDLNGLPAGQYSGTITDANGCSATASGIVVDAPSVVAVSVDNISDAACALTNNDGSISISVSGGTPPYTFNWSNGATDEDITSLVAGTYVGIVSDANGCQFVSPPLAVGVAPALTLGVTGTAVTGAGTNDGTATAVAAGGSAPYTFVWSDGQTTDTANGLAPGAYSVTVTDANGCTAEGTATVLFFLGSNSVEGWGSIGLYPNPAQSTAVLEARFQAPVQHLTIECFNALGQRVGSFQADGARELSLPISVAEWPEGMYFVRLNADGNVSVQALQVAR